jgi:hypothetical protein
VIYPCRMFSMSLKPPKVLPLFIILHLIIMFSLNFTLISSLSRIGSLGKLFFEASLKETFILFHAAPPLQIMQHKSSSSKWHACLGHPSLSIVKLVLSKNNLPVFSDTSPESVCDACQQGKSHQLPYPISTSTSKAPLELVFSDVWGHSCDSIERYKYYVCFIDGYSKFTWIYLLNYKSEVFQKN